MVLMHAGMPSRCVLAEPPGRFCRSMAFGQLHGTRSACGDAPSHSCMPHTTTAYVRLPGAVRRSKFGGVRPTSRSQAVLCANPPFGPRHGRRTTAEPRAANMGRANAHRGRSRAAGKNDTERLRRRSCAEDKRRGILACASTYYECVCVCPAVRRRLPPRWVIDYKLGEVSIKKVVIR